MIDLAGQDVGDGLNAAMRMPGESGLVLVRIVVTEIIRSRRRVDLGVAS